MSVSLNGYRQAPFDVRIDDHAFPKIYFENPRLQQLQQHVANVDVCQSEESCEIQSMFCCCHRQILIIFPLLWDKLHEYMDIHNLNTPPK